jgi:hypothetical protein
MRILLFDDWDKQFSGDITPHHQQVNIVEFPGIDKLPVRSLGAVQVGGKKQPGGLLRSFLEKNDMGTSNN